LSGITQAQAAALESALGLREDAAPDLYRVPLAVLTLLAEVAEERPLLCIVDDAQWIDHDSEQALVFAARRLHAEGVAMLFAAREGEFQPGVLPELRLRPLDVVAVRELLSDRSGAAVAEDVARRVAAATGGNALAVAELASLLTPAQLAAREPLPLPLPLSRGVERLFAERVRALAPSTQQLLVVAAADDTAKPEVVLGAAERLGLDVSALDEACRPHRVGRGAERGGGDRPLRVAPGGGDVRARRGGGARARAGGAAGADAERFCRRRWGVGARERAVGIAGGAGAQAG